MHEPFLHFDTFSYGVHYFYAMANLNDRRYNYKSPWITRLQEDDLLQCNVDAWDNLYNLTAVLTLPMEQLVKWLQRNNLLASEMCCGNADCNLPCKMNARSRSLDGYTWRCPKRHETSIRKFSFFSQSHLHLADIIMFIYRYAEGNSLWQASHSGGMAYQSTSVDWGNFVRDLFLEYYVRDIAPVKFTGIVEIDESLFGRKVKHNRGAPLGNRIWILGLYERQSGRLKLFPVDKRNATTLLDIILGHVEVGSTIYTDGWKAYDGLNALGFKHYVVEHKTAFKATYTCDDGTVEVVHTNAIEGAWKHAKVTT